MMWRLAASLLWRDWRAGELHVLVAALVLAVASVTAVGLFSERLTRALDLQANELLGADLVLTAGHELLSRYPRLQRSTSRYSETVEFPTMAFTPSHSVLVSVKGVQTEYPLRGYLQIADQPFHTPRQTRESPAPGTVWMETRLLNELALQVGDYVSLGNSRFQVTAVLVNDPTVVTAGMFNLAPRLIVNRADLAATGLISPTSRVRYKLLFAGAPESIRRLRQDLKPVLAAGERLESVADGRPGLRNTLERARQFLSLAVMSCVLLSFAALATTSRRYLRRHLDICAMLRCFGARQFQITSLFAVQLFMLGIVASALGCLAGYLLHLVLVKLFSPFVTVALPPPSWLALSTGLLTGLFGLLAFVLPVIVQLKKVSALRVLRRELGPPGAVQLLSYTIGLLLFATLLAWQAGDNRLAALMLGGFAVTIIALSGTSWLLLQLLRRAQAGLPPGWRFGTGALIRRRADSVLQIIAFGIGVLALLLLTLVRTDLLNTWRDRLPDGAPNKFLINIQADQQAAIRHFFSDARLTAPSLLPMVRGRLREINGRPVGPDDYDDRRAQRLIAREFNLSWAEKLQDDNRIVAGAWWGPEDAGKRIISVEEDLAQHLGIKLGDELDFVIGGQSLAVTVSSIRQVDWDSFRTNFFVLAPPGLLESYAASYISAFYLPPDHGDVLLRLVQRFPNITVLDTDAIIRQVRQTIDRVTMAVEFVFLLTLISGLLVMYAAIHATLDERLTENALLKALGARHAQLRLALWVEFSVLGLMAGFIAAVCADVVAYFIARRLFDLVYTIDPLIWLIAMAGTAVLIGIAGRLGTRHVLSRPPLAVLRDEA